ncbi:DUF1304 domain-containing protein [Catenuloplanes indicus]|uniref:Membrane protein n=1 Tax=Catenuloplanes indicus TaxID=137267 RepID=A0AAE3W7D4_9ACTN|nr:DUF1304 domain-containing protein [Catenuloplanes indicus]MDQ0370700.1 putative membrane protein [Catenuloplanes indicus]
MSIAANVVIGLVLVIHLYIVVLEMVLWTRPRGRAVFGTTPEYAEATKTLAANQGLYNGFLAAGLIWALLADGATAYQAKLFFLGCVLAAGLYGGATVGRRILFVQAAPAAVGLSWCCWPADGRHRPARAPAPGTGPHRPALRRAARPRQLAGAGRAPGGLS